MARKTELIQARIPEELKEVLADYTKRLNIENESEFLRIVLRAFGQRSWNEVRDFLYPADDADKEDHCRRLMVA